MSLGALALAVVQASADGTVNSPGTSMRSGHLRHSESALFSALTEVKCPG